MKSIWTCGKRKRWSVVENKQNPNHMLHSQRPLDVFLPLPSASFMQSYSRGVHKLYEIGFTT